VSVYEFDTFKNSSFAETVVYTPSGGAATSISAVVFRRSPKPAGSSKSDILVILYPITIQIDRTDIATVTVNEDTVTTNDINGVEKVFRVRAVISSDPGCWKLGL
jgi:hypothetical protein